MDDINNRLAKSLAVSVREYVVKSIREVSAKIEALEQRIASIPHGPKGDQGDKGERGDKGEQGERGLTVTGERGEVGPKGDKGEPGEAGIGLPGKDGIDGKNGRDGIDGKDGAPGVGIEGKSVVGDPGRDGESGKDGRDGRDGKDGRDGEAGRDALALDILPGIDPAKTYLRGTFARDRGGIVRYNGYEWEVIVDGLASIEILDTFDPRDLKVVFTRTSGEESVLERHVPMIAYRQIWNDELEYSQGDVVTWGGSAWHCERKTTQKPGSGMDWTLMVKEGRRGKDADTVKPSNGNGPVRLK